MVNSIKKGKTFEWNISKLLSKIFCSNFVRVPQSGATATNYKLKSLLGDIVEIDVMNNDKKQDIVIECKAYKSLTINDLYNNKSIFFNWIEQSERESKDLNWFLIFKINNKGTFVAFNSLVKTNYNDKFNEYKALLLNNISNTNKLIIDNNLCIYEVYKLK